MVRFFKSVIALAFIWLSVFNAEAQILYKVEKQGQDKPSYLLGTHHLAPLSAVDSIRQLPDIFRSIDKLYGEIDMRNMTDPANMMAMQKMIVAPADSTLDVLMSPAQMDSLRNVWDKYSGGAIPLDLMKMMKPNLISSQLAVFMSTKNLPSFNAMENIDLTMQNRAIAAGKEVKGLETMEYQIDLLYGSPISKQIQTLLETIRSADEDSSKAVELTDAYMAHDIDRLLELMLQSENKDPETAERLIFARNENWVKELTEILPESSVLVVVGAGHLPGERGLINGLEKEGYIVTPIE